MKSAADALGSRHFTPPPLLLLLLLLWLFDPLVLWALLELPPAPPVPAS